MTTLQNYKPFVTPRNWLILGWILTPCKSLSYIFINNKFYVKITLYFYKLVYNLIKVPL